MAIFIVCCAAVLIMIATADALEEMARDIALIEPNPEDWGGWVSYPIEQMEGKAEKRRLISSYEKTLEILSTKIQNRIKGGKW